MSKLEFQNNCVTPLSRCDSGEYLHGISKHNTDKGPSFLTVGLLRVHQHLSVLLCVCVPIK